MGENSVLQDTPRTNSLPVSSPRPALLLVFLSVFLLLLGYWDRTFSQGFPFIKSHLHLTLPFPHAPCLAVIQTYSPSNLLSYPRTDPWLPWWWSVHGSCCLTPFPPPLCEEFCNLCFVIYSLWLFFSGGSDLRNHSLSRLSITFHLN